tara:strand:+ start:163 stop:909 length:747 start_codon:yes stop_codon:yes gene_type:complete
MATSETTTFESTFYIDDIIEEAFDRIGLANVTGYQMKSARRSLNIMFQEWGNRGLHYWEIGSTNINLVEGQAEYKFFRSSDDGTSAVTTDPASVYGLDDVLEATFRTNKGTTNQSDSALTKIGRSTYSGLSAKLNTGSPSQYYVQRFSTYNSIFLYPTPNASAAGNEVFFFFVKRIQDAGGYSNTADVPYRFVPCMVSGLAFYLAQKYSPQSAEQLKMYYEDELNRALTEDGSSSSTYLTPQSYYPNV